MCYLYKEEHNFRSNNIIVKNEQQNSNEQQNLNDQILQTLSSNNNDMSKLTAFVEAWQTKNIDFIKNIFLGYHFPFDACLQSLFDSNVLLALNEITINITNHPNISFYALETIYRLTTIHEECMNFFLSPQIQLQNFIKDLLYNSAKGSPIDEPILLICAQFCYYICYQYPERIELLQKIQMFETFILFMKSSFDDYLDNGDGSCTKQIEIEKYIIKTMNIIIMEGKNNNEQEFRNAMSIIYFNIFNYEKRDRAFLYEPACDLFQHIIMKNPQFISILDTFDILKKLNFLICESEYSTLELVPIFKLLGNILSYYHKDYDLILQEDKSNHNLNSSHNDNSNQNDNRNHNVKSVADIIHELALQIDGSSVFGYLTDDYDSLNSEEYDPIYTNIFFLLSHLFIELDHIPDDICINPLLEVVKKVMDEGRSELKCKMLYFFSEYCKLSAPKDLAILLDSEFFQTLFDYLETYDDKVCYKFLDLIDCFISKYGRYGFESENIKRMLNETVPEFILHLLQDCISEQVELKAKLIMKNNYDNYVPLCNK
ncbi:hypothetical protein M9Y10_041387 [Tritrichomonas musculus]|uniref:Uncharacterized protein n=1 Tax=Tritrichomonas musculus TaxID=1915356 RepID=A0ABR2K470_9EUKA